MTPLHLEILVWHHCRAEKMENHNAPAVVDYRNHLIQHEILYENPDSDSGFSLTRKGEVWLQEILDTPFPVLQYVPMPRRK